MFASYGLQAMSYLTLELLLVSLVSEIISRQK